MKTEATPGNVRLNDGLGQPLAKALRRAYYYTDAGDWRGPDTTEQDRWNAVENVAEAAWRERCVALRTVAEQVLRDMQAQGILLEWQTLLDDALRA